jgi:hypothetical protein
VVQVGEHPARFRIMGVKLTGVELNGGDVYYQLTDLDVERGRLDGL